ncbi:CLUMA_CG009740, isoform A [Clunio marinus]|uniref:CLUMA_CG009740, isoform A n=1 Tax=Clunio marinus TaxID=568069 RepID=A0A1J1ICZ9_9DIPT|nr:CLUMA_CG009740, isoform A [Clunio marinus]
MLLVLMCFHMRAYFECNLLLKHAALGHVAKSDHQNTFHRKQVSLETKLNAYSPTSQSIKYETIALKKIRNAIYNCFDLRDFVAFTTVNEVS